MNLNEGGNVFKDAEGNPRTQRINLADIRPTVAWPQNPKTPHSLRRNSVILSILTMRVLIADLFSSAAIEEMKAAGMNVLYNDKLAGDAFVQAMNEHSPNVLVVRSKKVTAEVIDASSKLQVIVRAGAGTDTIDVKHAAKKGVYVANCPGKNAHAVSELTIGLILSIDRRMAEGNELLHAGKWNKGMFANCKGIKGRTLGLIGFGAIAQNVCRTAKALEMNVIVHTRTVHAGLDEQMGFKYASLDELLSNSDIVSLHTPSTPETKGLVNKQFLDKMKPDAVLINTARGNVVVDEALLAKLEACPDFWVGTDVFNGEPAGKAEDWSSPLSSHPRVYGTHHCGASTQQAESAIG